MQIVPFLLQLSHPVEVCEQGPEANERLLGGKSCAVNRHLREDGCPPWGGAGALFAHRKMAREWGCAAERSGLRGSPRGPPFLFMDVLLSCFCPNSSQTSTQAHVKHLHLGWVSILTPSRLGPAFTLLEGEAGTPQIQIRHVSGAPEPLAEGGGGSSFFFFLKNGSLGPKAKFLFKP